MHESTGRFSEPFADEVASALKSAVSITWDGCHKIYICLDAQSHEDMVKLGCEMTPIRETGAAEGLLYSWFTSACPLRFIQSIENKDVFHDVIPQFGYDAEDE